MVGRRINIFYVFKGSMYDDSAPVNRILGITRGLQNLGVNISIHNILPSSKHKMSESIHEIQVKNYTYLSKSSIKNKFLIIYNLFQIAYNIIKDKPTHIIQYGDSLFLTIFLSFVKAKHHFVHILEQNEYPYIILKNSITFKLFGDSYLKLSYRWFDRMFVISQPLYVFFSKYTSSKCKISIISMTVDTERFKMLKKIDMPFDNNIIYCGSLSQKKDGVENLLKAMFCIKNEFPDLGLVIIGEGNRDEESRLSSLIDELNLSNFVILKGKITKDKIPNYLYSATMLVLPRPNSLQAEGGFPTKLGEYLLSSKPVICTQVGEIPHYLTNKKDAYLIEPDSVSGIAGAIAEIINNPTKAKIIGLNGRKTGEIYFSAQNQAKKIINILMKDLF